MTIYRYASTGSNTSPYDTWAKAATSLATALAAASSPGDEVYVDMANIASGDSDVSTNQTWTIPDGVTVHVGTQNGASDITIGDMGTTYWIGASTTAKNITLTAAGTCRIRGGLTLREHGTGAIAVNNASNKTIMAEQLTLWHSNTGSSGKMDFNTVGNSFVYVGALTCKWSATSGSIGKIEVGGDVVADIFTIESGGATASGGLFDDQNVAYKSSFTASGGDISAIGTGASLVGDCSHSSFECKLDNVILPGSFSAMETQTLGLAGAQVWLRDCYESGVGAVPFLYANGVGEIRISDAIYLTAGIASASWKVTTKGGCSTTSVFRSPFLNEYLAAATVEPVFEVARDGSTTAYTDAQFWIETMAKKTGSSVKTTLLTNRGTGTNIPAGAGTGSWTGLSGTAWSGKLTQGSQTLAEDGFLRSRICAAVASSVIYVDPGAAA